MGEEEEPELAWQLRNCNVSLDITHLDGVGLPQCKPTQVSVLSRRRETVRRAAIRSTILRKSTEQCGLCVSASPSAQWSVHYQASVAMTVDCYCTVTLYKQ